MYKQDRCLRDGAAASCAGLARITICSTGRATGPQTMQLQLPHSKADIFSRGVPRGTAASCARLAMCTTAAVCGPVSLQVASPEQTGVLYMFLLLMIQSVACVGHDMRQQLRTVTTQGLVSWHLWSGQVIASLNHWDTLGCCHCAAQIRSSGSLQQHACIFPAPTTICPNGRP